MFNNFAKTSLRLAQALIVLSPAFCLADQLASLPITVEGTRADVIEISPSETKYLTQLESDFVERTEARLPVSKFTVSSSAGVASYSFTSIEDDYDKVIDDSGNVYINNGFKCTTDAGRHTLSIINSTGARSTIYTSSKGEQIIALAAIQHGAVFVVGNGVTGPTKGGCYFTGESFKVIQYNQETNTSVQLHESQSVVGDGTQIFRLASGGILINTGSVATPKWIYKSANSSSFVELSSLSQQIDGFLGETDGEPVFVSYGATDRAFFKVNLSNDTKSQVTYPIESTDRVVAVRDSSVVFAIDARENKQADTSDDRYGIIRSGNVIRNFQCSAPFEYQLFNLSNFGVPSLRILSDGSFIATSALATAKNFKLGALVSIKFSPTANQVTNYCGTVSVSFGKCEGQKPKLSASNASFNFKGFQRTPKCNVKVKVLDSQGNALSKVQVTLSRGDLKKAKTNNAGQASVELPGNTLCRANNLVYVSVGSQVDNFRKQYFAVGSNHKCPN